MTESQYTSKVVAYLKDLGMVVFKLSDHFTTGIPDVAVTFKGTTWLEFKDLKTTDTFQKRILRDKVQFFNMIALATLGRAAYVLVMGKRVWLIDPRQVGTMKDPPQSFDSSDYSPIVKFIRGEA